MGGQKMKFCTIILLGMYLSINLVSVKAQEVTAPVEAETPPVEVSPEVCPKDLDAASIVSEAVAGGMVGEWKPEIDIAATGDTFKKGDHKPPLKISSYSHKPLTDSKGSYCKYTVTDSNDVSGVYHLRHAG